MKPRQSSREFYLSFWRRMATSGVSISNIGPDVVDKIHEWRKPWLDHLGGVKKDDHPTDLLNYEKERDTDKLLDMLIANGTIQGRHTWTPTD